MAVENEALYAYDGKFYDYAKKIERWDNYITVTGKGFDPTVGKIATTNGNQDASKVVCVLATLGSAVLCSNTTLKLETDSETGISKWTPRGNSSEAPLVVAGQKVGIKLEALEKALFRVFEIPFSSSRKMMVTVTKTITESVLKHVAQVDGHTAHVKGAPNYILEKCTRYIAEDGSIQPLDKGSKQAFMDKVDELSSRALRVLAVASVNIGESLPFDADDEMDVKFGKIVKDLTLCGMCASIDPERDGVKDAVLQAKTAGVRVVMITGAVVYMYMYVCVCIYICIKLYLCVCMCTVANTYLAHLSGSSDMYVYTHDIHR